MEIYLNMAKKIFSNKIKYLSNYFNENEDENLNIRRNFLLYTYNFPEKGKIKKVDKEFLYQEAFNRGIPFSSLDEIYEKIIIQIPKSEYLLENLKYTYSWYTSNEFKILSNYLNYSFAGINNYLRLSPGDEMKYNLNKKIDDSPPLPTDIILYRAVGKDLLNNLTKENFISYGYLSTTFLTNVSLYAEKSGKILMRLFVSKGNKGIYIPSSEQEFLMRHDLKIKFISSQKENFIVEKKKIIINVYNFYI